MSLKKQDDKKYYIDWNYETIYHGLDSKDKIDIKRNAVVIIIFFIGLLIVW